MFQKLTVILKLHLKNEYNKKRTTYAHYVLHVYYVMFQEIKNPVKFFCITLSGRDNTLLLNNLLFN